MSQEYEGHKADQLLSPSAKRTRKMIIFMFIYGSIILLCNIAITHNILQSIFAFFLMGFGLMATLQFRISIEKEEIHVWRVIALAIMAASCIAGLYAVLYAVRW